MRMVIEDLPETEVRLLAEPKMTDDEFFDFCQVNDNLRIERTAEGEIEIQAMVGSETSDRNGELTMQLRAWAKRDGRGKAYDATGGFFLPNGAARGPDGSWILRSRLAGFTNREKRKFLRTCPDFVIELTSPSDRLPRVKEKMREYMENGAQLGWLLDPDTRTAYIYRPGREPEKLVAPERLHGESPVDGFVLDMAEIWDPA
jgi:Uma2 family endonuclease